MLQALGVSRSSFALLDEDEKGVHTVDTPGGLQELRTAFRTTEPSSTQISALP
uniref:Antirepressor n=3 Tax=unclassified Caudoviricetes TaxID=2788787 RepID=A0AB39U2B8_9CAUD